jgi:hypothetical protein
MQTNDICNMRDDRKLNPRRHGGDDNVDAGGANLQVEDDDHGREYDNDGVAR